MKPLWPCWLLFSFCCWTLSLAEGARKWPPFCEGKEEAARRESIKRIRHLNSFSASDNDTAFYGINQFSSLFPEEFKAIYLQSKPSKVPKYTPGAGLEGTEKPLPAKFDWRDKDVVTQVRNQGMCGGCWAFSVVGIVESVYAIKRKFLEKLSVQQVIDCSYNNSGCHGGSTVTALSWLNQAEALGNLNCRKVIPKSDYPSSSLRP